MKKFVLKLAVFAVLVTATIMLLLEFAGGYVDYYYPKFSSSAQKSMIIGDSRSVEGIRPSVVNQKLSSDFDLPMFNYSFTIAQATYGECYLQSIKRKLDPNAKNGLFILSVNPYMFLKRDGDDFENGKFFESNVPPHNMRFPSVKFNPEHFFKNSEYAHYSTLFTRGGKAHDDGWFEERSVPNDPSVRASLEKGQVKLYSDLGRRYKVAPYRLEKLGETIEMLKRHGEVVVVRMPVSANIFALEHRLRPGFDSDMEAIAMRENVPYLNFTKMLNTYASFDGVHLDEIGSEAFTAKLCDSIRSLGRKK
ncbi:MAG: hypothetical protein EOO50_13830 [Flavobacterium sp.]|uniref:hypothetical protein n=1 Tax=Flavobacterium sp. TaxID=239 RepID=UPI001226C13E|nr:hypothetical protein [Flavobacterium sp.]RZJ65398.1 MAG: hypothetical protein EOO50_13830 [Flavobacterium sp.]